MSFFSFILTERCNWDCSYCEYPLLKTPDDTTKKILKKHMPYIKELIEKFSGIVTGIDVQGGEIGFLDLDTLKYFFKYISIPVIVSTNGKFLERQYHKDRSIRPLIREIYYHIYQTPRKVKIDYKNYDDEIPIRIGIVHNNVKDIVDFIKMNPNIIFDYVEFENQIYNKEIIPSARYKKLANNLNDLPNVSETVIDILNSKINESKNKRDLCRKFSSTITIDLINERILLCHRSNNSYIPLTKENLIKRLTSYPKELFSIDNCCSCVRLYSRWSLHEFEDPIKARKCL